VQAIVSDLAEQMYYAAKHRLPDKKSFSITIAERRGVTADEPVYLIEISLHPKLPKLNCEIKMSGPIWSPGVYQDVAKQIGQALALTRPIPSRKWDTALLAKLTDCTPQTIERENQRLSKALETDFTNPELHAQAAVLLGAFLLRDHSGKFFEIRSPLSLVTAHLTMAAFLRGSNPTDINEQMAEAMLLTLVRDEAQALERLKDMGNKNANVLAMVRALQTRNTGDYRLLDRVEGRFLS